MLGLMLPGPAHPTLGETEAQRGGLTRRSSHHWHRGSHQPTGPRQIHVRTAQGLPLQGLLCRWGGVGGGGPGVPSRWGHLILSAFGKS